MQGLSPDVPLTPESQSVSVCVRLSPVHGPNGAPYRPARGPVAVQYSLFALVRLWSCANEIVIEYIQLYISPSARPLSHLLIYALCLSVSLGFRARDDRRIG